MTVPLETRILDAHEVILMNGTPENADLPKGKDRTAEKPISKAYPVIDNDLARDNLENDLPAADREDP